MKSSNDLDSHQQTAADAAKWRELTNLLRDKAYNPMTPEEISEQLPDLRRIYREANDRQNGHGRSASGRP